MNSFMSWVGGKKALRDEIVLRFPPTYSRYIEVFGGGGWVLFHKSPGKEMEVYNDFNPNLANLFRCVRDHPNELCDELRYTLNSRLDFDYVREMLKMNEDKFKDVNKLASLISAAGIGLILLVLFGSTLAAVKGMILCMILMYASISDIWRREVPDYVWAMIAILAFVRFDASNLPSMIVGALVVFVPQLAVSVMRPSRAIGGADIKISTALAFLLGA